MAKNLTKEMLEDASNYCLLLTVDDFESINNQRLEKTKEFPSRDYLTESIRCIKAWRMRGGFLKDIKIIIDYIGKNKLPDELIKLFRDLNTTVYYSHENYKDILSKFDYGFIGVHLTGKKFSESVFTNPIIIHIDLDMELLQPIPKEFFYPLLEKDCIIGGYRDEDLPSQRTPLFDNSILNSDMIITKRFDCTTLNIYDLFIKDIISINDDYKSYQKPSEKEYRLFDIEEYGVDKTFAEHPEFFHIVKEDSYEQGEGYFEVKDIDLSKVYFWHEHILEKPNDYFTIQKMKLMRAIKGAKNKS